MGAKHNITVLLLQMLAKYDDDMEQEARVWMEAVLGEPLMEDVPEMENLGPDRFYAALKDGILLCKWVFISLTSYLATGRQGAVLDNPCTLF